MSRAEIQAAPRNILDDIKQSRPFRSRGQALMVALSRTADEARHGLAKVLEPSGLTLQQYNVLWILRDAGESGLPTLEVADRMVRRSPGVTRLIDRLIEQGLVSRRRSTTDRRRVFCTLTDAGLAKVEVHEDDVVAYTDSVASALDESEMQHLGDFLDRIRGHLEPDQG